MKTSTAKRTHRALTLIEVLLVIAIIAILAMLLLPVLDRPDGSRTTHCLYNLKQIVLSMYMFGEDHNGRFPTSHANGDAINYDSNRLTSIFQATSSYGLTNPILLICPTDTRKAAKNFNSLKTENISYFLSIDVKQGMTTTIAAGDRNLRVSGVAVKPGLFTLSPDLKISWTPEMHSKYSGGSCGNVALGDGVARMCRIKDFAPIVKQQDIPTNRLIVP